MGILYSEQVEYMDVEEMQETHEREIALINEIDKLANRYETDTTIKKELEEKIDAYIAHVKVHFANEERLMQTFNFPSYEMHKMAHDMFLIDLQYATKHYKEYADIEKIINFIRKTPEWIVMHVNSVDAPTANFLASVMK